MPVIWLDFSIVNDVSFWCWPKRVERSRNIIINVYLNNSVGIGEHPQFIEELDKQIQIIADAQEKIEVLKSFEPERSVL